jgi:hypothetical protein
MDCKYLCIVLQKHEKCTGHMETTLKWLELKQYYKKGMPMISRKCSESKEMLPGFTGKFDKHQTIFVITKLSLLRALGETVCTFSSKFKKFYTSGETFIEIRPSAARTFPSLT